MLNGLTIELKQILDASWNSKKEEYEKRGQDKNWFYDGALSQIKRLNQTNGLTLKQVFDELYFITNDFHYREKLSKSILAGDYITELYKDVNIEEQSIGYLPDYKSMCELILDTLKELDKQENKRSFNIEAKYIDEFLKPLNLKRRSELLRRIVNNDRSFNINFSSKKFGDLYNLDLDRIKLLLTENAYRISVILNERTARGNVDMLSSKTGPESVNEYSTNLKILNELTSEIHNVAEFVANLSMADLNILIEIYSISLENRMNKNYISMADTINRSYGDRIEVFDQFETLETVDKIKKINMSGYNY